MTIEVREAIETDRDFILELVPRLRSFGPSRLRPAETLDRSERETLERALDQRTPDAVLLLAESSPGVRAGFAYVVQATDYFTREVHGHLAVLAVSEAGEGKGVGRALLTAAQDWSRSRGDRFLSLNVFSGNVRAREFYERSGFEPDTVRYVKPFDGSGAGTDPRSDGTSHELALRALRMLSACNRALTRIDDESRLLTEICRIVVDIGGYRMAGVGYAQDDVERSFKLVGVAGDHPEHAAAMRLSWDANSPFGQGPAGQAVRLGRPIAYTDFSDERQNFPGREAALKMGYRSVITLPLRNEQRTFGFVGMFSGEISNLRAEELVLLQELADNIAFGIGAIRAEAERRIIQGELAYNAAHDAVTGLEHYTALEPRLAQSIAAGERFTALLVLDLDRFKGINESMGHAAADEILRVVAARMKAFENERVEIAHFAGDEFVIALHESSEDAAMAFAERVREAISQPIAGRGYRLLLTGTIGISHSPAHGRKPLDLLLRAQAAKDRGKAIGRDCVSAFLTEQMQDIEDRVTLGGRLRDAVRAGELQLHYQPQVDAHRRGLTGFEALLRWTSHELGPVSPARFIPIAEALGLMPEIGSWVLREACRQARRWLDAGHAGFNIAINVSAQQMQRPGLVQAVRDALTESAIPPAVLDIEMTESSLMENVARIQDTLAELKSLGVMLSLDDFGTGYSSLSYLKNFPFDKVKIDQSFVRDLPGNSADAAIARTIVGLGHHLGLVVAAEGVETAAQADFLLEMGCDELQGYFLGRPVEASTAAGFFAPNK